jgi:hypothetical protein
VANYHEPHTEHQGLHSWSRGRWIGLAVLIAIVVLVVLAAVYGGGGGGVGGSY